MVRWLLRLARVAAGVFVGLPALAYLAQDRLLFHPQPLGPADLDRIAREHPGAERIAITAADGTRLQGWFVRGHQGGRAPVVIYFGGNAEEVSWMIGQQPGLAGCSLLLMNYRGYGGSGGDAGETALCADARRIYDETTKRADVDAERVVAFGRSLGTGVAVSLASERRVRGVVLVTPYETMTAVAKGHYPYLPVGWLLRHRFDSLARAPRIRAPVLMLAAGDDRVIPSRHARRLFEAWAGPKEWRLFAGAGHEDVSNTDPLIENFLRAVCDR